MKLTDLTIAKLPFAEGQRTIWDSSLPSFGVRIGTKRKTFVLKVQNRWYTLGRYPVITLKEARDEARRRPKADGNRSPAKMKYRLPDGSEWSGKGRIPRGLREALKGSEGYSEKDSSFDGKEARNKALEEFLIK